MAVFVWLSSLPVSGRVYPLTALLVRLGTRLPDLELAATIPPDSVEWRSRVDALPHLDKTWLPHWRG